MGLLIVGSILVLIACAIKCNKLMKVRFEKAEKILEKAKKGFKVDSNIISTI
jgi:predicted small secreted protein